MRRHTKASTAGSTRSQASGLGRFVRGGATRGGSVRAKGSSASTAGLLASLLALALAAMALLAAPASAASPAIADTWVEGVAFTEATLKAEINPEGVATNFHFKYGTTTAYGSETASGSVGSDSTKHKVSTAVGGLQPGTTYHYRVIATSSGGTSEGSDHTFTTYAHPVQETECPNQVFRTGAAALLPDCRAYELVSPPNKQGALIRAKSVFYGGAIVPRAAFSGGAAAYTSFGTTDEANPTSSGLLDAFVARRGPGGWRNEQIDPPFASGFEINSSLTEALTPDLDAAVIMSPEYTSVTPESTQGTRNLVFRDNSTGFFSLLTPNLPPNLGFPGGVSFDGMAADGSHVLISSPEYALNGEGVGTYDWNAETGELIKLPGSESPPFFNAGVAADEDARARHDPWNVVSQDGSRIFFINKEAGGSIFVRINGTKTQRVSESELAPGTGRAKFWLANPDGTVAYIGSPVGSGAEAEKLTTDATGVNDLYRYEVDTEQLTDITVDPAEEGAGGARLKAVMGAARDGSRVYFVAHGVLAPGATAGEENLYVWTDDGTPKGSTEYITTGEDPSSFPSLENAWSDNYRRQVLAAYVSPNGRYLTFQEATRSLTGYPNRGETEIYVYDAVAGELACASCNPSGEPARSGASSSRVAEEKSHYASRNVDDSGRVFFSTLEALVPWDVNGRFDAYEYDTATGKVSLLSSGTSGLDSYFWDISADGSEALITTVERLVGIDIDAAEDIYSVRIDGGLAAQNPEAPPIPCVAETCQNIPAPPNDATAASASFKGKGNPATQQNCPAQAKQAARLSHRAKRLRDAAKRSQSEQLSRELRKRSASAAKRADRLNKGAARCRRANRRAGK